MAKERLIAIKLMVTILWDIYSTSITFKWEKQPIANIIR